ncbi:MAG TPA: hypothetical protein VFR24_27190, partial [Candidatus Angelobacter sp.]|nr:hypothetical protein [Candidatus Angelobacter sp.]
QYSDNPEDLSNLETYDKFNTAMRACAVSYYEKLKAGTFMCIVVGPFRNKKTSELIDFPAHTVENFRKAGFLYHQQVVLSKNFGSAAKRSTNAWVNFQLVPIHEFLLIFRKPGVKIKNVRSKNTRSLLG